MYSQASLNAVAGRHLLGPRYKRGGPPGFFFFKSCIYFLTANCFIFYVLCHDVLLPLTMSIVYLFVSVLLLYQSVIKIDVPNKIQEKHTRSLKSVE